MDNGKYRIPEYHLEISHLICEDESWWKEQFANNNWIVSRWSNHVPGLKDNWQGSNPRGNCVFVLEYVG